jgi:hypothetical protein
MHTDHREYFKFTEPSRLEKAVNSLIGLIEGIVIDSSINKSEMDFLHLWLEENNELRDLHPFNELIPVVEEAISDGIFADDERQNILWLCEKLRSASYFDKTTADIQRLHALMAGIAADGVISETELRGLSTWLSDHDHLKTCWPYDEIDSLITSVLADGKIDASEQKLLQDFFTEFVAILDNRTIISPQVTDAVSLIGLCAICPEIHFKGLKFCFTGSSSKYSRAELTNRVRERGGVVVESVSTGLNYLIIGADGNPCWAYACYGRKVEKAVELRKQGAHILLVHEHDFHDAIADHQ